MNFLRPLAQSIRHLPLLARAEGLWTFLRPSYHRILNLRNQGVQVLAGGTCPIRIPPEYSMIGWEEYEPQSINAIVGWLTINPDSLFVDIGCAVGVMSVTALHASTQAKVIAIDSDLASLKATQRMCKYVTSKDRLLLVHGFATDKHDSQMSLIDANAKAVNDILAADFISGDLGTTQYVCLNQNGTGSIPSHSIDGLLALENPLKRPILVKCDVEGAELFVLQGLLGLMQQACPTLIISVHPDALLQYGHQKTDVSRFLERSGYHVNVIAIDHEEHWWCEPPSTSLPRLEVRPGGVPEPKQGGVVAL